MENKLSLDIIRQLPKAELHCHLDGFCRPQTVIELAKEQNVELPTYDPKELSQLMTAPMDCPDLVTYLKCFDIVLKVMQHPYAITRILYEACEDAYKDGITYLELRFAPALHTGNGHSYSQILEAAIDGCVMAEEKLEITPRIICCAMRHMSPQVNKEVAEICWRYRHRYVVGFDLAGPESGFPPQKHVEAFREIRLKSISVTIHAGEAWGADSVQQALACSANRIGHGTRIVEDERVLNEVIDRRIPLECCVSSNVQTKAVKNLKDHPIKTLFEKGTIVVPCTDNPTVSGVTLSGEYYMLQEEFGFSVGQIMKMLDYGFRSAFVPEGMRKRLRIEAFIKSMKILQQNNIDISEIKAFEKYYFQLGLTVPPRFEPPVQNPPLTLALLQELPKCDLDCRLIGSVPLSILYKFYCESTEEEKKKLPTFANKEEFTKYFMREEDAKYHAEGKRLSVKLLQKEENIREGVHGILLEAFVDNVVYMEITVSPLLHCKLMTKEQFLDTVLDEIKKFTSKKPMKVNVVINANVANLNPLKVQQCAELCVAYKGRGVVGFSTTTLEIDEDKMRYFEDTFKYLQNNFVPVTVFAGETNSESVPIALVRGNARRISGAFKIASSESLLTDVTSHNTTILVSLSRRFDEAAGGWFKSPVRSFFDFGVKMAMCSIHYAFNNMSRSQQLFEIAEKSGFDALSILSIIDNSFGAAFIPHSETKKLQDEFWIKSDEILIENGYKRLMNYTYFRE